jgi:3-oxoacyl-[acyl-carrier protein] reductase
MNLNGKTAIVTGASRGLGRATAISLAKEGANVVVNYRKAKNEAEKAVADIEKLGRKALAIQCDVSDVDEVAHLKDEAYKHFKTIDILINNAGTILRPAAWNQITEENIGKTIAVNLVGAINCIRAFAPGMVERKNGRIINITTTYSITGAAPVLVYTAAKAGITSLTYSMARELGPHGITVNAIAPGNFDTDLAKEAGDDVNNWAISTTPLGRLGKAEEIGEAAVFLAKADFITGHLLVIDGGQLLNM